MIYIMGQITHYLLFESDAVFDWLEYQAWKIREELESYGVSVDDD